MAVFLAALAGRLADFLAGLAFLAGMAGGTAEAQKGVCNSRQIRGPSSKERSMAATPWTTESPRSPRTVLVVDDDPEVRESLCDLLTVAFPGVACKAAASAEEGLRLLAGGADVVVSDISLPGMDGLQFLAAVRRTAPATPCMAMTGFPELDAAIEAVNDAHIESFFTKPLDPELVVRTIGAALQSRRPARPPAGTIARPR